MERQQISKLAENNSILTVLQEQKEEEGWEGRPKGMIQILWERWWIDERRLNDYTVNGKKGCLGYDHQRDELEIPAWKL